MCARDIVIRYATTAITIILFAIPAFAGYDQWTISGPDWANSQVVEVNPADTDNVYGAGANPAVGLFVSDDGASSWAVANDGLGMDTGNGKRISTFALDETDASYQFCALTDDGVGNEDYVFRSTDGGSSWTRILQSEGPLYVNLGCIDAYSGTVYVGTDETLYRSDDYGSSWSEVYTFSNDIRSLSLDPDDSNTVYVAASGVYKSVNGGSNFTAVGFIGGMITYVGAHKVGTDKYITASIYHDGFYISPDGGQNWHKRDNGLPVIGTNVRVPYDVAFSPNITGGIYAAISFGGVYKTTDGGLNWTNAQGDIENPYSGGGLDDMLGVNVTCFDGGGSDTVYIASNWGIHKSVNGGVNWDVVGVPGQAIYALDFAGNGPYDGFAGSGVGLFSYNSAQWDETTLIAEMGAHITYVSIDPGDNQTLLAGGADAFNYVYIAKSTDGGTDWTSAYSGMGQESGSVSAIEYDPDDPTRVFATMWVAGGYNDGGLLTSTDSGDSFTQNPYFDDTPLTGLTISPSNPDYIYVCGYYGGVWASDDGGASWVAKTGTGITNRVIAVDPANPERIYVGGQNNTEALYISNDGGTVWNAGGYGNGLIKSIVFADNAIVLGAYGDGVYYGSGGGWKSLNDGLENRRVNDVWADDNGSNVTLYAGTSGAGVYHIEVNELGIDEEDGDGPIIPTGFALHQSYPNPSKGTATISFALPETAPVNMSVYDIKGRKVATLANGTLAEGEYERSVSGLTSGIYLYKLEAGNFAATKKMVVK